LAPDTAILDNPKLTARNWYGDNPTRIVIDREGRIPSNAAIFNDDAKVIVFTRGDYRVKKENVKPIIIDFEGDTNRQILQQLYTERIHSLLVEGGARLLSTFIEKNHLGRSLYRGCRQETPHWVKAPSIPLDNAIINRYLDSTQHHLKNKKITQNFL
jgi:diaminohydroxyphosphoribosylaminopyrimidine deaminase/5-amino-6-(5-phosphoribosylamino)uracil reductase